MYIHRHIYIHLAGIIRDIYTFSLPMRFISKEIRKSNYFLLTQILLLLHKQIDRISAKPLYKTKLHEHNTVFPSMVIVQSLYILR